VVIPNRINSLSEDTQGSKGWTQRRMGAREAACYLGVSKRILNGYVASGRLVHTQTGPGCKRVFDVVDLEDFIARYRTGGWQQDLRNSEDRSIARRGPLTGSMR
jgi:hypothetical protein